LSNTPTTTHALRCFSGLPLFMVNSIGLLDVPFVTFLRNRANSHALSANRRKKVKIFPPS